MITLEESGLTSDQYNALREASSGATWSVTAHKYNLDFSEDGDDQGRSNFTPDFDAIACGDFLFRTVTDNFMEVFNPASSVWVQVTAYTGMGTASSIDSDGAQMVIDDDDLFVFIAQSSGIWMQHSSDLGNTFSSWSHVTSDAHVNKIAVVNKDRVHYTVEDTTKHIFNMRVAKHDGSWASTNSDINYTYPFSNFCAAELPDGSDMIVAATQVPGVTTVKLVVNVPTSYIKQQGGIIAFKYSNAWWGDHYDVDVVDELTAYRFRDRIKLTQFSDRVALTCYSSDGTQLFPYTVYRIYTTVDGKHWSKGNALPLPEDPGSSGVKLCQLGDYVYAVERSRTYKSLMTLQLGFSPDVCQLEIPHRRINQLSVSEGDMMQGSLTLSNEDGWLDDNEIISRHCRTLLVFKMGYWVDSENIKVQTNIAELDTYDMSHTLPRHMVKLTFRDFLAWMTDINSAERPYYWDSQLLGGDNFVDTSDDKYGGLRHLEPQSGSFTSEGSNLNLTSNNEEGVGFSTFSLYLWNGITQCKFALSTVSNGEYAGVTFRSGDKDNLWAAIYDQTTDKINLVERSGGTSTTRVSSATLSWASTPTTFRYIQAEFRYAHIIIRTSNDGLTWTDRIDHLMAIRLPDPSSDFEPLTTGNKERGYVGFIGKGFAPAEVDSWPSEPGPYDPPVFPPFDPPYFPPYDPGYVPYVPDVYVPSTYTSTEGDSVIISGKSGIRTDSVNNKVYASLDYTVATPVEFEITPPDWFTTIEMATIDKSVQLSRRAYVVGTNGTDSRIATTEDAYQDPPVWTMGDVITGEYNKIISTLGIAGLVHVQGVSASGAASAGFTVFNLELGTITNTGFTIDGQPYYDLEAEVVPAFGGYAVLMATSGDEECCTVTDIAIIGGTQNLGGSAWWLCGESFSGPLTSPPHSSSFINTIVGNNIRAFRFTSTTPVTYRVTLDSDCSNDDINNIDLPTLSLADGQPFGDYGFFNGTGWETSRGDGISGVRTSPEAPEGYGALILDIVLPAETTVNLVEVDISGAPAITARFGNPDVYTGYENFSALVGSTWKLVPGITATGSTFRIFFESLTAGTPLVVTAIRLTAPPSGGGAVTSRSVDYGTTILSTEPHEYNFSGDDSGFSVGPRGLISAVGADAAVQFLLPGHASEYENAVNGGAAGSYPMVVCIPDNKIGIGTVANPPADPDFFLATPALVASHALWKVVLAGKIGITPVVGSDKALAVASLGFDAWRGQKIMFIGVAGATRYIFTSVDGGLHWTKFASSTARSVRKLCYSITGNYWIVSCGSGGMLYSNNSGLTWHSIDVPGITTHAELLG